METHAMDPSGAMLEDFGQRVDLTRRIREVLLNYPEGTTVLKELIQNADDAGATVVRLCLDRRSHGTGSLLAPSLAQWQGPALLAYNDAVFTDDDYASISRIGDSKKHAQVTKTGRFGVGFNSVYHLTDLPSFVSGKYAVLFDPQGTYLPNVSVANPGKRLDYVSSSALSFYRDQFVPYCAFGCDMKKPFCGTLFRFPLRSVDQAAISKLSRQSYLEDDVLSMFNELYKEAVFTLLFLKSIISMEMYVWEAGTGEPVRLYSCSLNSPDEKTAWHRQALRRFSSAETSKWQTDSFSLDFLSEAGLGLNVEKRIDTFFIVQGMASELSKIGTFAAATAKEYDLHLLPWASVAACISDNLPEGNTYKQGRAFCFLPLPVRTGLTVQVNGYFEVSSNRRSIWYGVDMDRGGKHRSDWNRLLLEDVVAPAFSELLLGVRTLLGPTMLYYSLWPSGSFEEPWNILVEAIYNSILLSPVFYSEVEGGKWISPIDAFIHDENFTKSSELSEALISLRMPIVHIPIHLVSMFHRFSKSLQQRLVNPERVRHFLKGCESLPMLQRCHKLILLEYCLSDLNDDDVGRHVDGLPLVPLANGHFGVFSEAWKGFSYYICNELEYKLLILAPDRIIDRGIPFHIYNRLTAMANRLKTNLAPLDDESFLQFLPMFFPARWKQSNRVSWNPDSQSTGPSEAWFLLFWQYLQDHCSDLSKFSEWPILPSTSGHLYRASEFSKLVDAELLPNAMEELLAKIGCKILNRRYRIVHRELSRYVHSGNAAGIVDSIFEAVSSDVNQLQILFRDFSANEKNKLRQFLLDPKWYFGGILSEDHIKKCKKLPIYRVYDGECSTTYLFSDLECPKKYLPPVGIPDILLSCEFILCPSDADENILTKYYAVRRMQKTIFYRQNVLNRLDVLQPDVRESVMLSILQELPQLSLDDSLFKESLRLLKFVPTISGSLESPHSLYDPRVEELSALLEDSDCFPSGLFQKPDVLDMLLQLGLRTSVSVDAIIKSARQIESMVHKDQWKAHLRGKILLSYLEVNALKWLYVSPHDGKKIANVVFSKVATAFRPRDMPFEANLERFWNDMRMICWCPVLVTAPHPALPWPSTSSMVAPPKLVRLEGDMWLVSASTRILDGECSSSALSNSLGWSSPPSGSVIAAQLLELGKNNEVVTDNFLRQELALAMPRIYNLLENLIGSDEMDIVKAILEGCRWVWVGDGFATANEVVLHGHFHLAPYIRVIPVDLAVFRGMFLELGIREDLKPIDYANILCSMAKRKGQNPLDAQELRMAISVVQHLAEIQFQDLLVQVYLPDTSSIMFPVTDLVYDDAPWLLDHREHMVPDTSTLALNSRRNIHKFVHGNLSNDVADKLGVRSLRRLLLAESSDSMNLSLAGVTEAFGQHEALTTRLKHIVEMYADGPGILFELVQNAEDARASEVVFLLDKTQYGTSSILSPEMAEWQGPALYCYNDSVFSSQDLYAISRIGQDSKLEKPFAIGRFGLGFNCVYHFTDIPCFVSGENIVMFDPHACYLPGISPSHPGLRIKFVGRRVLEHFPDQFSPFLHFGCDLQQPFPGTLFRFPLRTEITASRSHIKRERYSPEDVESLFFAFKDVACQTLLFLRHIKTVTVYVKDGAGHEMKLIHRFSRHNFGGFGKEPDQLHPMLSFIRGNQQIGMDRDQFFNKLSKINDKDLPRHSDKVVVVEQGPHGCMSHNWIISDCIGGGRAKNKLIASGDRSQNFIPWACVAAYLHSVRIDEEGETMALDVGNNHCAGIQFQLPTDLAVANQKHFEGKAFCFLPLPISTGLPIHVNAYFELSSNRRDIWSGNDMAGGGRVRSEWNSCVLEDVIAPAYSHLLAVLAEEIGPCDLFFSFWPTVARLEPWDGMVQKVYLSVADLGLPVLHTKARGGKWVSTRQAIFPDFTFPNATELAEALSEAGLPIVTVSKPVLNRFMDACPSLHFLNPHLLRILLTRRKREFRSKAKTVTTLEYCLSDLEGSVNLDSLIGLPLVPLANGSFTTFKNQGDGERIFVTCQTEYDLLKDSVPQLLVDYSIPDGVSERLHDIAQSAKMNLCVLTCDCLVELFPRILPAEWLRAKQVPWSPGHSGQPSLEWMHLFWSYLKASCKDLSMFYEWPILPVGNGCLLQLVENSNVIRDDGWSESMSSLLQKLGCCFLRSDLPIDHPLLKNYVQDATASGILNAVLAVACHLQDIKALFLSASKGEMHELRNFLLQSKWFSRSEIDPRHADMLRCLPMFESYGSRELVSLGNPVKWLKPEGVPEDLLDENFIRAESDREENIIRSYLGIGEPSKADFYKDFALSRMSSFLSQPNTLSAILLNVKILVEEDSAMKRALSEMPYVLAANGTWQHPSRLYDPRVPSLQRLLHREVFFPSEKFLNAEVLDTLGCLGLQSTLSFTAMIDSARSVSIMHDSEDADTVTYGQALLLYMNALGYKLSNAACMEEDNDARTLLLKKNDGSHRNDSETKPLEEMCCKRAQDVLSSLSDFVYDKPEAEFWSSIKTIAWCPVYVTPCIQGLPWFTSNHHVATPDNTRPMSQMWMVSSRMRILDGHCCSTYLENKLGWMNPPDVDVLVTQLTELSRSYSQLKLQLEPGPLLDVIMEKEIPLVYSKLQDYVGTDEFDDIKKALDCIQWVWVGDNFVSPKALAFDSPVKYHPYLYVVPSELAEFRLLLSELGVRSTFEAADYLDVLKRLERDLKGESLSTEQLNFVHCVLEAFGDCFSGKNASNDVLLNSLLIPDSSAVLRYRLDLLYNDAPWMEKSSPAGKYFVHPCISDDLSNRLGVQSLRCLSLVDEELTRDLPCMDYGRICELLASYGDSDCLLFDLLELADHCKAEKVQVIYDKREHPRQYLLQNNLGEFQGPALTVVLEGCSLNREEVCSLQLPPPWKIHGGLLGYGLGLISSYFVCDLLMIVSCGYYYIFDPLGLALSPPSSNGPSARLFSLIDTGLTGRFCDQFTPMLISQEISLSKSNSTIIRMPLSSKCLNGLETGSKRVKQIFDRFRQHASPSLLFLKSVLQVSISTWEEGNLYPSLDFSISINPAFSSMRNPFSEKKWRKFQISRYFGSPDAATKMHVIDIHVVQAGQVFVDKWMIALSLGSGRTRDLALDRRYLAYNLTPVAGVAALISQNGQPISARFSSCILSPLPLSGTISMPVIPLGYFLVCHGGGRYLSNHLYGMGLQEQRHDIQNHLIEEWNKELMSCVRDSYVEMVIEFQKLRKNPLNSVLDPSSAHAMSHILHAYGDRIYTFWPRSQSTSSIPQDDNVNGSSSVRATEADWKSLINQVIRPFYECLVKRPVWQLYCGNLVKAEEGMFLSQSGIGEGDNLPPASVCSFIKEHYPVFSVPWELVNEIQAVGIKVRKIEPKMVRDLLKASSSVLLRSVELYVDVLEYCLSDIKLEQSSECVGVENGSLGALSNMHVEHHNIPQYVVPSSSSANTWNSHPVGSQSFGNSGTDALEMVSNIGRAVYDFGRGVVEDIGRSGASLVHNPADSDRRSIYADQLLLSTAAELKGLPFPTATKHLVRLGLTEWWVGNEEQQLLMRPLAHKFIHPHCLQKPFIAELFSNRNIQLLLKLNHFSLHLLAHHMRYLFSENWVSSVMSSARSPWVSWDTERGPLGDGPAAEWIQLFWKIYRLLGGDLSLLSDWPLIPAFLHGPVLCRIKVCHLVFVPPIFDPSLLIEHSNTNTVESEMPDSSRKDVGEEEKMKMYLTSYELTKSRYPWLLSLLSQFNTPVYDMSFLDLGAPNDCFPPPGQSLGQVILSKLYASKRAGYFSVPSKLSVEDRDSLFNLFGSDFISSRQREYKREELDVLRELPVYKTVLGTYTHLSDSDQCIISAAAFFHPKDERCLSISVDDRLFYHALGVHELRDREILVSFALPGFEKKTQEEQGTILSYLYKNWEDLHLDQNILGTLKETNFVCDADEHCESLFKPRDLLDPYDPLLASVFCGEKSKFPGERFTTDRWLQILRKTGLRTSSQADMVVECAKKVETLGRDAVANIDDADDLEAEFSSARNAVSFDIWSLAGSVVDTIVTNFAVLYDSAFCETLSKIAFVPAEKGFPSIGGKKGGKRVLASYSDAILLKDWPLAWSSAPILAREKVIPPEYSWGAFHLKSPPAFSVVLKHLQIIGRNNGEDTLAHWPASSGVMTAEDACLEILKYLDRTWGTLSSSDAIELQNVAFLAVANGTRLVSVKSLFARLTVNLSPFAFELPTIYLPFVKILKEIGMREILSVACARDFLLNIQQSCGYQRLNPNELRAVMEILMYICGGTSQSKSDGPDWLIDAIVPDDGCRLVLARSCVYVDPCGSHYLGRIDTSRLRFAHPELPENVRTLLGIKKLSDIVVEELNEEQQLEVVNEIGSIPLLRVRNKLLSNSLQQAVWYLINVMTNDFPSFEGPNFPQIQSTLQYIAGKLQFVRLLYTRFLLLPKNLDITRVAKNIALPEWEDSSRHRAVSFVDKSRSHVLIAEPPSYMSVYDVIATAVSQILGAPATLLIGPLFSCPDGSEKGVLNVLKLGSEIGTAKNESRNIVLVGKELLPQDALQVQFLPLRPFYTGEIVAWKLGKDGERLKYGRVPKDVRPSAGQALYRFLVETAPGEDQVLLSSQVFCFRSVSMADLASSTTLHESVESTVGNRMVHGQKPKDTKKGKMVSQDVGELQYGKVSATELVQAVHDMLSSAGINLDFEKQRLVRTTLTLQEQLKESQVALLVEQEKADAATKEADAAKTAWSCQVCLSAEVNVAIVPCGHVLCQRCSSAVSRCPFCRIQVSRTMKIFRS